MGLNRRFASAGEKLSRESITKAGFWENIVPFINQGMVVPIISNSFRIEHIFRDEKDVSEKIADTTEFDDEDYTIDERLTKAWAKLIEYPMPDNHNLARVAQYHLIEEKDSLLARVKYLNFLKDFLLSVLLEGEEELKDLEKEEEGEFRDLIRRLKIQTRELHFSEIVRQLDYPKFPRDMDDPLQLLARFPLPIYVTTSYYDFLERALETEGKKPRTQICFWNGAKSSAKSEHIPDPNFEPTPSNPAVYHLYGLENYPQTLVLSEDDYMNFLVSTAEDTDTQNPIVPLKLRQALAESPLLLLGYHLREWDFRALFRFILKFRRDELSPRGMVIQIEEDKKRIGDVVKSLEYLSHYFDKKQFDVEWTSTESFIQRLSSEWNNYRRGQS